VDLSGALDTHMGGGGSGSTTEVKD
jgi:hypothetical protein